MKTRDLMTEMNLERYIAEIMKIPLVETQGKYNRCKEGGNRCHALNSFGTYRSVCAKAGLVHREIIEQTSEVIRQDKLRGDCPSVRRARHRLRELVLEYSRLSLKKRELEDKMEKIQNEFLREIIHWRFFENLQRRVPSWTETAKALGISVTGEELRRYTVSRLSEENLAV